MIRQALAACSEFLGWAEAARRLAVHRGGRRRGRGGRLRPRPRRPGLRVSLALDCLDFAPAARSTR